MKTYIIKTRSNEYYCGKTNNIDKRLVQHKNEKYPHWFCNYGRRNFVSILVFNGNFEKRIKRANSKLVYELYEQFEWCEKFGIY